jgi:putative DNA primase/helicase
LDLKSFELLPSEVARERLITQLCDVEYDPDAECPEWEAALARIFEADKDSDRARELTDLLQIGLGYSLTGDQSHHHVFLLYGPEGSNGKSLVVEVIQGVLGRDYASTAPPGLLNKKRGEAHPTGLAELCKRRFVSAMEFAADSTFDAALLKLLSGGDMLKARRMREDFWSFSPTHHLWLGSNYIPHADAGDTALWRRFRVLPFNRRFLLPGEPGFDSAPDALRADPCLAQRILDNERAGVLAWMVRGQRKLREGGQVPAPDASRQALAAVQRQVDPVRRWLAERCELAGETPANERAAPSFTPTAALYADYLAWCGETGEQVETKKAFGVVLNAAGLATAKRGSTRGRKGIRLRDRRKP